MQPLQAIERNDQLVFKVFLFFVNIFTLLGQYVYGEFVAADRDVATDTLETTTQMFQYVQEGCNATLGVGL